jgi:hypothetical protein
MGRQDRADPSARKLRHVCVEHGRSFGVKGSVLEGAHAEHMVESGFARAQGVKEISPSPPDAFAALHERQRTQ